MSADVDTVRAALASAFGDWEAALAALDRLAAAEAQRDTFAERIEEVRAEFKANVATAEAQMVAMPEYVEFWRGRRGAFQDALGSLLKVRAALAAVAPTEAKEG